jgi:hypothetical protein
MAMNKLAMILTVIALALPACKDKGGEHDADAGDTTPPDQADQGDIVPDDASDTGDAADVEALDGPGTALLTWEAPTTNEDGTPLTNLAGYRAYYGTTSGSYSEMDDVGMATCEDVGGVTQCTTTISGLPIGTWYFAVTAYNSAGLESVFSNEAYKTIE